MSKSGETKTKRKKVIGVGKKDGRPKKEIDFNLVKSLCSIQCTGEEIASIVNVNYDTLVKRIKDDYNETFSDFYKKASAGGKASLRRTQFKLAEKSAAMCIWLGKQYLGQKDQESFMATERETIPEFDKMSDADLDKYIKESK